MARELIALALIAACRSTGDAGGGGGAASAAAPLASAAFYRVDAAPPTPCTANAPCEARLVLTALGAYHVNTDYPFKFVSAATPDITVDGNGTFATTDAKTGTLVIKFRTARAGTAQLRGTFKLSVCTEETCEIEAPAIALPISAT